MTGYVTLIHPVLWHLIVHLLLLIAVSLLPKFEMSSFFRSKHITGA